MGQRQRAHGLSSRRRRPPHGHPPSIRRPNWLLFLLFGKILGRFREFWVNWLKSLSTFGDKYPQNPHEWLQDRTWDNPQRGLRGNLTWQGESNMALRGTSVLAERVLSSAERVHTSLRAFLCFHSIQPFSDSKIPHECVTLSNKIQLSSNFRATPIKSNPD